ncbi:MAG TPA: D-alanyl-D-alanine carboxypeptidase/D-alanyl-D-alanine-endopeptidase [Sphingobacteriaceae bacterium]
MNLRLSLLLFFISLQSFGQGIGERIGKAYAAFESDPQMKYGISSLTVINGTTGQVVFQKNENTGLASASTLKTVTAATAYYLLGPDFKWETKLSYTGRIENGTLKGDLYINGGGDPTFGSWRFPGTKREVILSNWISAVRQAGIKQIEGRIIADDRLFGTQTLPVGWTWQDMGNYYGAGPNSLTWHENQFDLHFKAGRQVGEPAALLKISPALRGVTLVNEVTTGKPGTGDNVYIYSAPYSEVIYIRGTYGIDLKKVISGSVPDPAFQLAGEFADTLNQAGVPLIGSFTTARKLAMTAGTVSSEYAALLATHVSPDFSAVNYWFNQKSINLYGEHILKTLAWKKTGMATTDKGVKVLQDFWSGKCGIDPDAINIMDGSGLSPGNRITTSAMASVLQAITTEPWFASFYEGLPVYNGMKMKSGTINDVLAYTGYQTSSAGEPLVFSFIVNNYNGSASAVRQKMFKVLDVLK